MFPRHSFARQLCIYLLGSASATHLANLSCRILQYFWRSLWDSSDLLASHYNVRQRCWCSFYWLTITQYRLLFGMSVLFKLKYANFRLLMADFICLVAAISYISSLFYQLLSVAQEAFFSSTINLISHIYSRREKIQHKDFVDKRKGYQYNVWLLVKEINAPKEEM